MQLGRHRIRNHSNSRLYNPSSYWQTYKIYIVPDSFLIKTHGILGAKYLEARKAILNFSEQSITLEDGSTTPFLSFETFTIPSRTKHLIKKAVRNPEIKEGYLARIDAGSKLFLGEALFCTHDAQLYIRTLNYIYIYLCNKHLITSSIHKYTSPNSSRV